MPSGLDPLSQPTRTAKRNLLVVSVLAITYKAFDVTIDKIPISGLSISFDNRVFVFLLLISLVYFLGTFLLYYFIDIRNIERTSHEDASEGRYETDLTEFRYDVDQGMRRACESRFPGYAVLDSIGGLSDTLRAIEAGGLFKWVGPPTPTVQLIQIFVAKSNPKQSYNLSEALEFNSHQKVYFDCARFIRKRMRGYKRRYYFFRMRLLGRLYAVRFLYVVRNYGTDGILPIALGLVAFASLYELVNLDWLRHIAPPK